MPNRAEHPVVILYEHPLLGEGIARCVLAETGVTVTVIPAHDIDSIRTALACDPSVVIFELSKPLHDVDLAAYAPHAELVDVSPAMSNGPVKPSEATKLDRVLAAVRRHSMACRRLPAAPATPAG